MVIVCGQPGGFRENSNKNYTENLKQTLDISSTNKAEIWLGAFDTYDVCESTQRWCVYRRLNRLVSIDSRKRAQEGN